jgi:hypothetical protein
LLLQKNSFLNSQKDEYEQQLKEYISISDKNTRLINQKDELESLLKLKDDEIVKYIKTQCQNEENILTKSKPLTIEPEEANKNTKELTLTNDSIKPNNEELIKQEKETDNNG